MIIIAIGGVSSAGKSSLAVKIQTWVKPWSSIALNQNDFVKDVKEIPMIRDHIDWESPQSIDWSHFHQAIIKVQQAIYRNHCRRFICLLG